jgi:hypothetical protein
MVLTSTGRVRPIPLKNSVVEMNFRRRPFFKCVPGRLFADV